MYLNLLALIALGVMIGAGTKIQIGDHPIAVLFPQNVFAGKVMIWGSLFLMLAPRILFVKMGQSFTAFLKWLSSRKPVSRD